METSVVIPLDLTQSLALAVVVLLFGQFLRKKIPVLERFCIPAPVVGGLLFSIMTLIGMQTGTFSFNINATLQSFFMMLFFTTVGFTASAQILKKGGIQVFVFLAAAVILVALQDVVGVALAKAFGLHPLLGLATGSVAMTGGHGTAGAFGPLFESEYGITGATTVAIAAATFGLVAGSTLGGPIGRLLITKNKLAADGTIDDKQEEEREAANAAHPKVTLNPKDILSSFYLIAIALGLGSIIQIGFKKVGLTFPAYIGSMLIAAAIRNIADAKHSKLTVCMDEIGTLGDLFLSVFLAYALMTLKLWELADLAVPLVVMLTAQAVLTAAYAFFVTFRLMGKDYDAAVMTAGHCGFGMGATPNAMANMQAVTLRFGPSVKAFFIVPIIGALFIDFFNATIITTFMNIFG